jgi:hypothetical protein
MNWDFEFSRGQFYVDILSTGVVNLTGATAVSGPGAATKIKTIVDMGQLDSTDNIRPVEWTTTAESRNRQRETNPNYILRYPTDGQAQGSPIGMPRLIVEGDLLKIWPLPTNFAGMRIYIEAYCEYADWTASGLGNSEEPWTTRGQQFLLWGTIIHLNYLRKTYVPRTEGNLASPTELRNEGLEILKQWDTAKFEQYRRHGR